MLDAVLAADGGVQLSERLGLLTRLRQREVVVHVGALLAYGVYATVFLSRGLFSPDTYAGNGPVWDQSVFAWLFAWWPYALTHGLDPLHTGVLWAGSGYNVNWMTTVPLLALVAWPITATAGPAVAFDTLMLAAPVLTAYTSFLLCRRLTHSLVASLLGGLLFGYSAFTLTHFVGHLNLIMLWPLPLALYLCLRYAQGDLSSRRYVALLSLVLLAELGISTEVAATFTFTAIVVCLVVFALRPADRSRILAVVGWTWLAYLAAAVLFSPFLVSYFTSHPPAHVWSLQAYQADLLGPIIPTPVVRVGRGWFSLLSSNFAGWPTETGTYIGLATLVMLIIVAVKLRRSLLGVALAASAITATVLSFGANLRIAGYKTVPMPGRLLEHLPLFSVAVPERFAVYATLAAAVAAALFIADQRIRRSWRLALGACAVVLLLPNPPYPWHVHDAGAAVFRTAAYRRVLPSHAVVLVLPWDSYSPAMAWQAETNFAFRIAGGYTPTIPTLYRQSTFAGTLSGDWEGRYKPGFFNQWLRSPRALHALHVFLRSFGVNAIIVMPAPRNALPGTVHPWSRLLDGLRARRVTLDGLTFYTDWQHTAVLAPPGGPSVATTRTNVDRNSGAGGVGPLVNPPQKRRGRVVRYMLRSAALGGRTRPVYVYLPAAYATEPARRFPVIYLLHGMPGIGWGAYHSAFHVDTVLDALIGTRRIKPVIAVIVSGNTNYDDRATEWANGPSPNAQWDTYLSRDVVGAVDRRYRTIRTAAGRAIAGYSAGANGAVNQLILHRTFGAAGLLSADLVQSPGTVGFNAAIIRRYSAFATLPGALPRLARQHIAVFMSAGSDDWAFHAESWAARLFGAYHVTYRLLVIPHHGHSWGVWRSAFRPCLIYLANHLATWR